MDGFIFGVISGGLVVGLAMTKSVRIGFKELVLGIWERIKELFKKKEEDEL